MTREEILNMPAGREMDALIAVSLELVKNKGTILEFYAPFSTDIGAAWEVVEKMKDTFSEICIDADKDWRCYFDNACASAETAPLAICRAALLAVMK